MFRFVPQIIHKKVLLEEFEAVKGSRILLPSSAAARTLLQNGLKQQGYLR